MHVPLPELAPVVNERCSCRLLLHMGSYRNADKVYFPLGDGNHSRVIIGKRQA